ncbi:unnamed protein product, partial [Arabidopsis halleri]
WKGHGPIRFEPNFHSNRFHSLLCDISQKPKNDFCFRSMLGTKMKKKRREKRRRRIAVRSRGHHGVSNEVS